MAYWSNISIRRQQVLQGFGAGINTFSDALYMKDNEMRDSYNLIGDSYPSVRTRADRVVLPLEAGSTDLVCNTLGVRSSTDINLEIHKVQGNTWEYGLKNSTAWTQISTAVNIPASTVYGKIVEFNTMTARYSILANSDGTFYNSYWDGTNYSTFASTASPRSNLITAHRYRLYGIDGRLLRYSAQGDITDWSTVDDAGWIDLTDQVGKANAITTFNDHVIVWSDKSMYELYGSYVDNYELVNVSLKVGCVSSRAYCECNGKLFWLDYAGIYMYTGGQPRLVALQLKKYIEGINWDKKELIWSASKDSKIMFNVPYQDTKNNYLLVIDIKEIDTGVIKCYTELLNGNSGINVGESLYSLGTTNKKIWELSSTRFTGMDDSDAGSLSTNPISWMLETKIASENGFNVNFNISDIWVQHEGSTKATMQVGYWDNKSTNSTTFTALGASSDYVCDPDRIKRTKLLMNYSQLQNIDMYKMQIKGTGKVKIHGIQMNMYSYGGG